MEPFTTNPQAGARFAPGFTKTRKRFGQAMLETAFLIAAQPSPEAARMGVYMLAALVGLLVCGFVSVAKELREERAARP